MGTEKLSKGIKGGKRSGAGRKKGIPNKKTAETQRLVQESGVTPLEFMLAEMRNEENERRDRLASAIAAAPYVHPRLAAIEIAGDQDAPVKVEFSWAK